MGKSKRIKRRHRQIQPDDITDEMLEMVEEGYMEVVQTDTGPMYKLTPAGRDAARDAGFS